MPFRDEHRRTREEDVLDGFYSVASPGRAETGTGYDPAEDAPCTAPTATLVGQLRGPRLSSAGQIVAYDEG